MAFGIFYVAKCAAHRPQCRPVPPSNQGRENSGSGWQSTQGCYKITVFAPGRGLARNRGCLAQMVERLSALQGDVGGSIPSAPTRNFCSRNGNQVSAALRLLDFCIAAGVVVQLVRIPACHAGVAGSSPVHLPDTPKGEREFAFFCHFNERREPRELPRHVRRRPQQQENRPGFSCPSPCRLPSGALTPTSGHRCR